MTRTSHLLGLTLALALSATTTAGCAPFGDPQDEPVELSVKASVTDKTAMEAVVAEFHRLHPDTRVTVDFADTGALQQDLPGELRAGRGPDVFTVWPGNGNPASVTALERDDLLENLSLRRFNLTMPMGVKPVTDVDGGTFAVPVTFSGIGAVFSMGALDDIGGDTAPDLDGTPGALRQGTRPRQGPLRRGQRDPLGHPAHPLRPGRHDRVRRRTGLRPDHGTRQGDLRRVRLAYGAEQAPGDGGARLLQRRPLGHDVRGDARPGGHGPGGGGRPGRERALAAARRRPRPDPAHDRTARRRRPRRHVDAGCRLGRLRPRSRHSPPQGGARLHRLPGIRPRTEPVQPLRRHPARDPERLLHRRPRDQGGRGAAEGRLHHPLHGPALAELRRPADALRPDRGPPRRHHGRRRGPGRARRGLSGPGLTRGEAPSPSRR
ncbi:exported protein of unknown function [Streptomyces ambofaciens ATCC 23877]|uniref:Extracellular solute-binding protein n=1 Tax=Streptomyces ambofaciens (strain ATCC 23877 / 3486 / DSM 40053 / JCM 4204 / NBRC 12836 / NRRL B-2516) TaxID=278992 RepID=A0A0K2AMA9_STRA7|nr:exported protein of unknown function [Streptomyces ambofaciens ATCC 23877]